MTAGKGDKKASLDAASWLFNVVTSVGIIIVNKSLMATHGFSFGTLSVDMLFICIADLLSQLLFGKFTLFHPLMLCKL